MYTLATLDKLRQRLGLSAADTTDNARLLGALQAASAEIERQASRRFCPHLATREHDVNLFEASELLLTDDLLELLTLTDGDGTVFAAADYITIPDTGGDTPIGVIRLVNGGAFTWDTTPIRAVGVTGIWGWHDRWSQAWRDSGDSVQDSPFSAGASTLTVADADGADSEAESPRFQAGHLLRIDAEYLRVLAVNTTTNVLTVQRGVNGTTAAAHSQSTTVEVYQPPREVEALALRWAAWLFKEPDSRGFAVTPLALTKALDGLRRIGA